VNPALPRAPDLNLIGCEGCGLVLRRPARGAHGHCPRCEHVLHARKPDSLRRCWAYLIAAALLYLPANLLPIMRTTSLFDTTDSTIYTGILTLWDDGAWDLALIVFVASIMVPLLKLASLSLLLLSVQRRSALHARARTRLYRIIDFIGRWSMLDVFVVALLVTLVHFGKFAQVDPGIGILPFGAVVILTMLASMSFDPRLIWDAAEAPRA
jgi:paraquat-inducible protein A